MEYFSEYIIWPYVLVVIGVGYLYRYRFQELLPKKIKLATKYAVLILAAVIGIAWYIFDNVETDFRKYAVSYTLATSLYELIFKWLQNQFKDGGGYFRNRRRSWYGGRDNSNRDIPKDDIP